MIWRPGAASSGNAACSVEFAPNADADNLTHTAVVMQFSSCDGTGLIFGTSLGRHDRPITVMAIDNYLVWSVTVSRFLTQTFRSVSPLEHAFNGTRHLFEFDVTVDLPERIIHQTLRLDGKSVSYRKGDVTGPQFMKFFLQTFSYLCQFTDNTGHQIAKPRYLTRWDACIYSLRMNGLAMRPVQTHDSKLYQDGSWCCNQVGSGTTYSPRNISGPTAGRNCCKAQDQCVHHDDLIATFPPGAVLTVRNIPSDSRCDNRSILLAALQLEVKTTVTSAPLLALVSDKDVSIEIQLNDSAVLVKLVNSEKAFTLPAQCNGSSKFRPGEWNSLSIHVMSSYLYLIANGKVFENYYPPNTHDIDKWRAMRWSAILGTAHQRIGPSRKTFDGCMRYVSYNGFNILAAANRSSRNLRKLQNQGKQVTFNSSCGARNVFGDKVTRSTDIHSPRVVNWPERCRGITTFRRNHFIRISTTKYGTSKAIRIQFRSTSLFSVPRTPHSKPRVLLSVFTSSDANNGPRLAIAKTRSGLHMYAWLQDKSHPSGLVRSWFLPFGSRSRMVRLTLARNYSSLQTQGMRVLIPVGFLARIDSITLGNRPIVSQTPVADNEDRLLPLDGLIDQLRINGDCALKNYPLPDLTNLHTVFGTALPDYYNGYGRRAVFFDNLYFEGQVTNPASTLSVFVSIRCTRSSAMPLVHLMSKQFNGLSVALAEENGLLLEDLSTGTRRFLFFGNETSNTFCDGDWKSLTLHLFPGSLAVVSARLGVTMLQTSIHPRFVEAVRVGGVNFIGCVKDFVINKAEISVLSVATTTSLSNSMSYCPACLSPNHCRGGYCSNAAGYHRNESYGCLDWDTMDTDSSMGNGTESADSEPSSPQYPSDLPHNIATMPDTIRNLFALPLCFFVAVILFLGYRLFIALVKP